MQKCVCVCMCVCVYSVCVCVLHPHQHRTCTLTLCSSIAFIQVSDATDRQYWGGGSEVIGRKSAVNAHVLCWDGDSNKYTHARTHTHTHTLW